MLRKYHIEMTRDALDDRVSPQALQVITRANLSQDNLLGLVGHPEFHFDDSAFAAGYAYLDRQRALIQEAVAGRRDPKPAWRAFGRLSHAVQDFYAHSNYLALWQATYPEGRVPPPETVDPLDQEVLSHPELRSGRIYFPLEALTFIPGLDRLVRRWLPRDAHAWMNLDSPARGPLFPYAVAAARRRTRLEFEHTNAQLHKTMGASAVRFFSGFHTRP